VVSSAWQEVVKDWLEWFWKDYHRRPQQAVVQWRGGVLESGGDCLDTIEPRVEHVLQSYCVRRDTTVSVWSFALPVKCPGLLPPRSNAHQVICPLSQGPPGQLPPLLAWVG